MHEFPLIKKYFAPLARDFPGSLNLTDDAALLATPEGSELVVTTDAICEGVHFLGNESPDLIAKKLLRVNLSDLAAMGARPICYFLALMLPASTSEEWVADFARGLAEDQKFFDIALAGGDTTATHTDKISLCATAVGNVPKGKALRRSGAKPGDLVFVSGTLGDAALGLATLKKGESPESFLAQRYLLPKPRLALGEKLRGIASAAMDISDGLLQDLAHLCTASNAGAKIYRKTLPLSQDAATLVKEDPALWETIQAGGDDYELLFTVPPEREKIVESLSRDMELPLARIGEITESAGVTLLGPQGEILPVTRTGYAHFQTQKID